MIFFLCYSDNIANNHKNYCMSPNPPFSILKKALFRPYTVLFRPIKSQCFRQFSSVIQSVILASKIIFKKPHTSPCGK